MRPFPTLLVLLLTLTPDAARAQGRVLDDVSMSSRILKSERKYAVYLPPDYDTSQRSYPVLYLLHGGGDDHTGWVQFGEVQQIADRAIRDGTATPMIIIMPDANTGRRGFFNSVTGDWRYEDFFFEELLPHVEQKYRIRRGKRYRAVAGLSMGGGGSFVYALHHPELFSSAAPLSASVGDLTLEQAIARTRAARPPVEATDAQVEAHYRRHGVLPLIAAMPDSLRTAVRWYIDVGDDDFLFEGNALVHIAMRKREIPHEFRIRDGGHTWSYWRSALPTVLEFVSVSFHQR